MEERLQKVLATAGVTSRRKAEQLIVEGRVMVNGKVITELGSKADPERDHIKVDGKLLKEPAEHVYIAFNKPDCVVSTASDPQRRTTVLDFMKGFKARVFPVGRLDYHSQGLILLTNDGEFANAISAARNHVPKTYLVKANGTLTPEQEENFRTGVPLSGVYTAPAGLRLMRRAENPWYEIRLIEGRNQQIRTMFKHFGLLVEKLKRVRIGNVELGTLKPGEFRLLTPLEASKMMRIASREIQKTPSRGSAPEGNQQRTGQKFAQREAPRAAKRPLKKARKKTDAKRHVKRNGDA